MKRFLIQLLLLASIFLIGANASYAKEGCKPLKAGLVVKKTEKRNRLKTEKKDYEKAKVVSKYHGTTVYQQKYHYTAQYKNKKTNDTSFPDSDQRTVYSFCNSNFKKARVFFTDRSINDEDYSEVGDYLGTTKDANEQDTLVNFAKKHYLIATGVRYYDTDATGECRYTQEPCNDEAKRTVRVSILRIDLETGKTKKSVLSYIPSKLRIVGENILTLDKDGNTLDEIPIN